MFNQWFILIPEITFLFFILNFLIYGLIQPLKSRYTILLSIQILIIIYFLINNSILSTQSTLFHFFINDYLTIFCNDILFFFAILFLFIITPLILFDIRYTYEYFILILITIISMLLLIKSNDLISMYLTIELQSMAFYILAAFGKISKYGTEAALKYYVMGALASNFFLLGLAFLYSIFGFTHFLDIQYYLLLNDNNLIINSIFLFILIGFVFKIGGVPFHQWLPDVYQGSPLASTLFFSIIPKLPLFFAIYRLLLIFPIHPFFFSFIIFFSFFIPTILALKQYNLKRLFAYSSINHVAFLLISTLTGYWTATFYYLFIYLFMNVGLFAILILFKTSNQNHYYNLLQYSGKALSLPLISFTFSIFLFSMAGIPPLAGFFSKYYILENSLYHNHISFTFFAIFSSIIAAFYYLQIIQYFYFHPSLNNHSIIQISSSTLIYFLSSILLLLFLFFFQQNFIFHIFNQFF